VQDRPAGAIGYEPDREGTAGGGSPWKDRQFQVGARSDGVLEGS
jgi:hypothetical protein